MASPRIKVLVSLLMLPLVFYTVAAKITSVVEVMVYCQSCKNLGTWSLSGATSISSAKVSITCTNHRNRIFYYKEYTANEDGYIYAKLDYDVGHYLFDHPIDACKVKLVSSPSKKCNVATNVNYGIEGASLEREHKSSTRKDCDLKFYTAGPLAFRPANCTSDETQY